MYLSPDQRFLTPELLDTTLDPEVERRRKQAEIMAGLTPNKGASKGPEKAAVTIVEFSDFECPFCRRFAQILDQLSPDERKDVRVVFHHMPLSMHPWARAAAEGAACAQLQSADAFWSLHDQLFAHQAELNQTNLREKLTEYASENRSINLTAFKECLENELSLGLVFRDMDLAAANNVSGTPTLFINGSRIAGVKDIAQLCRLIQDARAEAHSRAVEETKIADR